MVLDISKFYTTMGKNTKRLLHIAKLPQKMLLHIAKLYTTSEESHHMVLDTSKLSPLCKKTLKGYYYTLLNKMFLLTVLQKAQCHSAFL